MRESAPQCADAAPQAPARNPSPHHPPPSTCSLDTYNSHRKIKRPRLLADKRVYRPARRHTLARIEESSPRAPPRAAPAAPRTSPAPPAPARPRSKSLQHSTDLSSTAPWVRSRSNVSADTSRSVPVCDVSRSLAPRRDSASPQYAEPRDSDSSLSDAAAPARYPHYHHYPQPPQYPQYPQCAFYHEDGCVVARRANYNSTDKNIPKHNNVYLAFMY